MDMNEYQKLAIRTDSFGASELESVMDMAFMAKVLGIVGEAGEYAEKIKKIIRNNRGKMSDEEKQELIKELGDILWYVAVSAHYFGKSLEEIAQMNIEKLSSRQERKVINSKGDNR